MLVKSIWVVINLLLIGIVIINIYKSFKGANWVFYLKNILDIILLLGVFVPYALFLNDPFDLFDTPVKLYFFIFIVLGFASVGGLIGKVAMFAMKSSDDTEADEREDEKDGRIYILGIYLPLFIMYGGILLFCYAASASV